MLSSVLISIFSPIIQLTLDTDIRAQTIVVLTSGKGLEHALIIRRNKNGNKVGPITDETGIFTDIVGRP